MNKHEIIQAADTVIAKGEKFISTAKDIITCCEIFLTAVYALKEVLSKEE